jgi:signal peptidase I
VDPADAPGDVPADHRAADTLKAVAELLSQTGEAHYIPLRGNSMLPLLRNGDQVLVTSGVDGIRTGDIVVFQRDREWIAHRVLRVERDGIDRVRLRTKGDHVMRLDTPLNVDSLVGKVLVARRNGQQMRLDTRSWRCFGRFIAGVMRFEVWLYGKAVGEAGSDRETRHGVMLLTRGMLWFNSLLLRGGLVLAGSWEG